jgi:SNF2 family DNA or RNA helicase
MADIRELHEKLKKIRTSKTLELKPTPLLRTEIIGQDGKPQPLRLRYYQAQGIFHLLVQPRMVLGDGTGLGKTVEVIGALCHLWAPNKEPHNKVIVVTPKSALRQWAGEIARFTVGVRCYVVSGTPEKRRAVYEEWKAAPTGPNCEKAVLLLSYPILQRDWDAGGHVPLLPNGHPDPKKPVTPGLLDRLTSGIPSLVTVFDEATAFKNMRTKTWQTCRFLSDRSKRCYGLTATLLKNNLIEGFSIYKAVVPPLFTTKQKFMDDFCHVVLQKFGARRIPIITGYKHLDIFRERIDPYFLGRPKHMVSDELPKLVTREVPVEMSLAEDVKYKEALDGILELGDGEMKEFTETKALTSLIYCQQIVNSLHTLKFEDGQEISTGFYFDESTKVKEKGSKEEALLDLITGELDDEKIIIYTRFEKLVTRLQQILKDANIKSVRITGKESDLKRRAAQQTFQDMSSDTKVIFITDAGSEAINLQSASAMIFYDAPWSWGNYVQLLGRSMRIGSVHDTVVVYHLIAERPEGKYKSNKTIDHHVLKLLGGKKGLVDKVLGEAAVGALEFGAEKQSARDLIRSMQQEERGQ